MTEIAVDIEAALASYTECRRGVARARVELATTQTAAAANQERRQRWVLAELNGATDEARRHEVSDATLSDDQKQVSNSTVRLNASIEEYDAAVRTLAVAAASVRGMP